MEKFVITALILVVLVGVVFFLWDYFPHNFSLNPSGGGQSFWSKFFNFSSSSSSSIFSLQFPKWNPVFTTSSSSGFKVGNVNITSNGVYYSNPGSVPSSMIPNGLTRSDLSPYFKRVVVSSLQASYIQGSYYGNSAQITISSGLSANEKVDITGWHIKGRKTDVLIPQAVDNYSPYSLNNQSDIVITGGSVVNIYTAVSPISRNIRLNQCTGFLQQTYNFNPAIPMSCPVLYNRADVLHLAGFCQSYIYSLGSCQVPSTAFINSLPGNQEGNDCEAFLRTITVNSCYDRYSGKPGFLSNTWLVWISSATFDPQHDIIDFYDNKGKLVDEYIY